MMQKKKRFYTWGIPLCWTIFSLLQYFDPGDEYAFYALQSFVGVWMMFLTKINEVNSPLFPISIAFGGAVVMLGVGFIMDKARIRKKVWGITWGVLAIVFLILSLKAYPTLQRAIQKNGSLLAYLIFAINMGLHASNFLTLAGKGGMALVKKIRT